MKASIKACICAVLILSEVDALAQKDSSGRKLSYEYTYASIDTMEFYSKKLEVMQVLVRDKNFRNGIHRLSDSIFSKQNAISKIFINSRDGKVLDVPTIPMDNIIIDDSKKLIIGLSRAMESPYQIVIYNFDAELLFKKKISQFELVLDSREYGKFIERYPEFFKYAESNEQILFADGKYYVDLGYWNRLSEKAKDDIKESGWFKTSHYFPDIFRERFGLSPMYQLTKYTNFYSQTDPFYEFEMSKSDTPIGIILNDEFGGKVRIPLNGYVGSGK